MPNRCSVANCTSNYDGTQYTPVFEMLNHWSKDTQEEWRKFLHREDAWELARVFICANHFGDDDLFLHFEIPQHDGTVEKVPRKPGLRKNAKPIYLPNCPSYLQRSSEHAERFDRNVIDVRHFQKALELSLAESKTENEKFSVSNIEEIEQKHSILNLAQKWFYFRSGQTTLNVFKRILSGHLLIMSHQILIYGSLHVRCFLNEVEIKTKITDITDIRQISDLIEELDTHQQDEIEVGIMEATDSVRLTVEKLKTKDDTKELKDISIRLQFILCQLENLKLSKNNRRYNVLTLVLSLKAQLISSGCYRYLQSLECLSLPHPSTLRRLYSNMGLDTYFIDYLKVSCKAFNKYKRNIILQLDEIHVKTDYTYKGGKIFGSSCINWHLDEAEDVSSECDPAKTVLAFQVSSLYTKWSEIVRLLPCCNTKASELLPIVQQVIIDIEKCDLRVIAICTDDYQLNVRLFKSLADKSSNLELTCPNPSDPTRSIFLMFDPVHIVKCIRNNWINQKDTSTTFTFPSIDHYFGGTFPYQISTASFIDLRNIYKLEQFSNAKIAHKLTSRVVWPSTLERQSVPLALAVWDQSTYNAVLLYNQKNNISNQTSQFISLITRFWKMCNIHSPGKDIRLLDPDSRVFTLQDERFEFFSRFVSWLQDWKTLTCIGRDGKLSSHTFTSLIHTCRVLPRIVNYLTSDACGFSYVLTGFLQNDSLEKHFGVYRLMSGCNYNISLCQILESERRIKLSNILKLYRSQDNTFETSLKEFVKTFSVDIETDNVEKPELDLSSYYFILHQNFDFSPIKETLQALTFIAGYAIHSIFKSKLYSKKVKTATSLCPECVPLLTQLKSLSLECEDSHLILIELADRGGLKYPSVEVINAVSSLWRILFRIEQNFSLMRQFVISSSRNILIQLSISRLEFENFQFWRFTCPKCQTPFLWYLNRILFSTSNCLLKNKVRNLNSKRSIEKSTGSKRKLQKLQSK